MIEITYNKNSDHQTKILYDDNLLSNLTIFKKAVLKKGWDFLGLIVGRERSGKSTLGMQICKFFDHSFNVNRVVFSAEQFENAVREAKPHQAILWDEAIQGAMSAESRNKINITIAKMFTQIGQKELFIVAIMPNFWDFNRYLAVHRSFFLIKTEVNGFSRGSFRYYDDARKKFLYLDGKNNKETYSSPSFWGRFKDGYTVDVEAYKIKKMRYGLFVNKQVEDQTWIERWKRICFYILENKLMTTDKLCEITGISKTLLNNYIKEFKIAGLEVKRGRKKTKSTSYADTAKDDIILEFPEDTEQESESISEFSLPNGS